MANQDPFVLLKEDHQKVADLLDQILDTTERAEKTRKELFSEVKESLETHSQIEEAILYPMMENVEETRAYALEAEEEHAQVKTLLEELDSEDETTEEWTAKITVMKENIQHHVQEEENEIFPTVKAAFSEEQLEELATKINEMHP